MKSTLQPAKDKSKQLSNPTVNTAKTFEQNSRQIASAVSEDNSNNSQNNSSTACVNTTTYSNTTTATMAKH